MAVQPLSPATHHRLGRPLPYQLANAPQAPRKVDCSFKQLIMRFVLSYPVLSIVSNGYPRLYGRLPTCYSPVRHGTPRCTIRLACIRHAASVNPEPGSNSPKIYFCSLFFLLLILFCFKELLFVFILTLSSSYIVFKDSIFSSFC